MSCHEMGGVAHDPAFAETRTYKTANYYEYDKN